MSEAAALRISTRDFQHLSTLVKERFGLVLARALAPLGTVCELAAPLLAHGGYLVASTTGTALEAERARGALAGDAHLHPKLSARGRARGIRNVFGNEESHRILDAPWPTGKAPNGHASAKGSRRSD